jgi:hypothetical protein
MATSPRDELEQEEPLSKGPSPEIAFSVPGWLRHAAAFFLAFALTGSVVLFIVYFTYEKPAWEPSKVDLVDLIIFCSLGLAFCALPWEQYQFRIRKIGPVELEQIVSAQAQERDEGLHELRKRVEAIEAGRSLGVDEQRLDSRDEELARFVKSFLSAHNAPFSPLRISSWGTHQPGFEKLGNYSRDEIRRVLQGMAAKQELETVVSKRGNTLYRLPKSTR